MLVGDSLILLRVRYDRHRILGINGFGDCLDPGPFHAMNLKTQHLLGRLMRMLPTPDSHLSAQFAFQRRGHFLAFAA